MNSMSRRLSSIFTRPNVALISLCSEFHQWRGIRVKVRDNNLDRALGRMQSIMRSSGIERMIKNDQIYHIKNSEKRVLARKNLMRKLRSEDMSRKLQSVILKKVRGH